MNLAFSEDGVISVELVVLFPVIALIVVSILEFGHLWYVRETLTIASREGARAAVVYINMNDSDRINWAIGDTNNNGIAQGAVIDYMKNTNPRWVYNTDYTVPTPTWTNGPAGTLIGGTLTVTVQANQSLLFLHKLFKPVSIVSQTTMRFE
jgi:Flp pilus assembly protein TadG